MTTFYLQKNDPDPLYILRVLLPELITSEKIDDADKWHLPYDKSLFARFYEKYQIIVISAGLPHGDYGQTVCLYKNTYDKKPDVGFLCSMELPEHLFDSSKVISRYSYLKEKQGSSDDTPREKESLFFRYKENYQPTCFEDVVSSLRALRDLSTIMYKLQSFRVVLLENGIYVELLTIIRDDGKPSFALRS